MKNHTFFVLLALTSVVSYAQAYEDKIEYNKQKQACLVYEFNFPPEAVEDAFINRMSHFGHKGKEEKGLFNRDKGFRVYKDARINDISHTRYDYITFIERKSKKETDVTILYLIIMKDDENVLDKLSVTEHSHAKNFMRDLHPHIEDAHLEIQIREQEDIVSKAEKKLRSLHDDKDDMEKKIKKLEDDLKKNEKDQEKQAAELESHRKVLEDMKGKRKKSA